MAIALLGLNYKTCPVEIRENFTFTRLEASEFLDFLKRKSFLEEIILISTCNRTEFYILSKNIYSAREKIISNISKKKNISSDEFEKSLYFMTGKDAVKHLFSVASGIDSMILGEGQILGQTKKALELAQETGSSDSILEELFRRAITCGKKARTHTRISTGPSSVSFASVEFAKMIFGSLEGKSVMILGAGKMGQLTAKLLAQHKLKQVIVANKTYEKALELAKIFGGEAIRFNKLPKYLIETDILISSTGAPHYVLHYDTVLQAMKDRENRILFLLDIAVPRDIEPEVNKIPNVFLYDIDDLRKVVEDSLEERKEEIFKVRKIIEEELDRFISWYKAREAVPIIKNLRDKAENIRKNELDKAFKKLSHLQKEDICLIDYSTRKIINKLLHSTVVKLKEISSNGRGCLTVQELVCELFDLGKSQKIHMTSCENSPENDWL